MDGAEYSVAWSKETQMLKVYGYFNASNLVVIVLYKVKYSWAFFFLLKKQHSQGSSICPDLGQHHILEQKKQH